VQYGSNHRRGAWSEVVVAVVEVKKLMWGLDMCQEEVDRVCWFLEGFVSRSSSEYGLVILMYGLAIGRA